MPNSENKSEVIRQIATALVESDRRDEEAGLGRLVTYFGYDKDIKEFATRNGLVLDYSNSLINLIAWSLVGPQLARKDHVYLGRKVGRPKGKSKKENIKRAEFVESIKSRMSQLSGTEVSSSEIIRAAQEINHPLFSAITPAAAANSVTQGKKDLKAQRLRIAELLSQKK